MGKIIKILIVLVFIVIAILAGVLLTTDINQYKGQIVQIVRDNTGRDFEISGNLKLAPSLIPTIAVEGVSLGNAKWAKEKNMLSVGKFEAQVALIPLLKKNIQINRIVLIEPTINLETDKEGIGNWVFKVDSNKEANKSGTTVPTLNINEIDIEKANLTYIDGVAGTTQKIAINKFSIETNSFGKPLDMVIDANYNNIPVSASGTLGSVNSLKDNKTFRVDVRASVNNIKFEAKGSIEKPRDAKGIDLAIALKMNSLKSVSEIIKKELPAIGPIDITGKFTEKDGVYALNAFKAIIDKTNISGDARIADIENLKGLALNIKLDSASVADFNVLAGKDLPDMKPLSFSGSISDDDKGYHFQNIELIAGNVKVSGNGDMADLKKLKGMAFTIKLDADSLSELSALAGKNLPDMKPLSFSGSISDKDKGYQFKGVNLQAGEIKIAGNADINMAGKRPALSANINTDSLNLIPFMPEKEKEKQAKEKVFSSDPLPLEKLKSADVNLNFKAKRLITKDLAFNDFNLDLKLINGKLKLVQTGKAAGGTIATNIDLDGSSGKTASLNNDIEIKQIELGQIPAIKEDNLLTGGKSDISIKLKGNGASVAAIMASSNGKLLVKTGKGHISNSAMNTASTDVLVGTMSLLNPGAKKEEGSTLECAAINFNIKDGIATADKGIGILTNQMNIIGSGTVNLKTEELDIGITPKAREGLGISLSQLAELVRLGGTLANPTPKTDTKAALMTGLSAGAAVATGGLSILAQGLFDKSGSDINPCDTALGIEPKKQQTTTTTTTTEKPVEEKSAVEKTTDTVKDAAGAIGNKLKGLFGD